MSLPLLCLAAGCSIKTEAVVLAAIVSLPSCNLQLLEEQLLLLPPFKQLQVSTFNQLLLGDTALAEEFHATGTQVPMMRRLSCPYREQVFPRI